MILCSSAVGENSHFFFPQQIWVLPRELERYRTRQTVIIMVRWIQNSIRISTVRVHAPYKYPPRNTMPKSPGTNSNPRVCDSESPGATLALAFPLRSEQNRHKSSKQHDFKLLESSCIYTKGTYIYTKETYVDTKETYSYTQETSESRPGPRPGPKISSKKIGLHELFFPQE